MTGFGAGRKVRAVHYGFSRKPGHTPVRQSAKVRALAFLAFGVTRRDLMFDSLQERLGSVLAKLKDRGALKESDVAEALREVRVALLEADVALPVVKDFIAEVQKKAVGEDVLRSITPGQMVIKIHEGKAALI